MGTGSYGSQYTRGVPSQAFGLPVVHPPVNSEPPRASLLGQCNVRFTLLVYDMSCFQNEALENGIDAEV